MQIVEKFMEILAEAMQVEASELGPETNFKEVDGWDSMAAVSLVVLVDQHYARQLTAEDVLQATTVRELFELVTG